MLVLSYGHGFKVRVISLVVMLLPVKNRKRVELNYTRPLPESFKWRNKQRSDYRIDRNTNSIGKNAKTKTLWVTMTRL